MSGLRAPGLAPSSSGVYRIMRCPNCGYEMTSNARERTILLLKSAGPLTPGQLATTLGMSKGGMASVLRQLHGLDLIAYEATKDRRTRLVRLVPTEGVRCQTLSRRLPDAIDAADDRAAQH
jgi:DNA-binding MarR family transcriptional regulator